MADAQIIQLFKRDKPPAEDSTFWEWGKTFVEHGILNLEAIVEDVAGSQTEEQLKARLAELRAEVETYPLD